MNATAILPRRRKFTTRAFLLLSTLTLTNVALAQQSTSVQGGGTLSYSVSQVQDWCGSGHTFYMREFDYSNFVYTDTAGGTYPMSGSARAYQVTGDNSGNCPPAPPNQSAQLSNSQGYVISVAPSPYSVSATLNPIGGVIGLKYVVLAVTYAPPGAKSNVTYSNSTAQGLATSFSKTFTDQTSLSVTASASAGFSIYGVGFNAGTSATASGAYTQEKDSSSSLSLNTTTTYGREIFGPASSTTGIDHSEDVIWVWLNPMVNMSVNPDNSLNWSGFSYDARDISEMDIVPLYVSWLKNPQTMPADVVKALSRSWDPSGNGGLTTTDYQTILARDPLAVNAAYNPNTDTSGRFDLQAGHDFNYEPPSNGGQPVAETYSLAYQSISTAGQGASDTSQVGLSIDAKLNVSLFLAKVDKEIKTSNTATWVSKTSSLTTDTNGQTASLSITGPASTDNYTGPTRFEVWRDNIYGTFMFYAVQ